MAKTQVDIDYFKGEISIPNLGKNPTSFTSTYIDRYQKEIQQKILGVTLYNLYITGINADDPIDERWDNLLNGKDYTVTDGTQEIGVRWNGFINSENVSLLSYYIYCKYVEQSNTQLTGLGNSTAVKENAQSESPRVKLVNAYNNCAELVGNYPIKSDNQYNILYPNDINESYLDITQPSLLNYLYYHMEDYPEWVFQYPDIYGRNRFDL
jgi:hypothetical protein